MSLKLKSTGFIDPILEKKGLKPFSLGLLNFITGGYSGVHKYAEDLAIILSTKTFIKEQLKKGGILYGYSGLMIYQLAIKGQGIIPLGQEEYPINKSKEIPHPSNNRGFDNYLILNNHQKKRTLESVEFLKQLNCLHFISPSEHIKKSHGKIPEHGKLFAYLKELNYVVTIHGFGYDTKNNIDLGTVVKYAKKIITNSDSNKYILDTDSNIFKKLLKINKEDTIYIKEGGIISLPLPFNWKKRNIKKKEKIIVNLSRIISYKKIKEFILLAKELLKLQEFKDYRFILFARYIFVSEKERIKDSLKKSFNFLPSTRHYFYELKSLIKEFLLEDKIIFLNAGDIGFGTDYSKQKILELKEEFPTKVEVLKKAQYVLDSSELTDKDRVQYTNLEAMEYQCFLGTRPNFFGNFYKEGVNGFDVFNIENILNIEKKNEKINYLQNNNIFLKNNFNNKSIFYNFLNVYTTI